MAFCPHEYWCYINSRTSLWTTFLHIVHAQLSPYDINTPLLDHHHHICSKPTKHKTHRHATENSSKWDIFFMILWTCFMWMTSWGDIWAWWYELKCDWRIFRRPLKSLSVVSIWTGYDPRAQTCKYSSIKGCKILLIFAHLGTGARLGGQQFWRFSVWIRWWTGFFDWKLQWILSSRPAYPKKRIQLPATWRSAGYLAELPNPVTGLPLVQRALCPTSKRYCISTPPKGPIRTWWRCTILCNFTIILEIASEKEVPWNLARFWFSYQKVRPLPALPLSQSRFQSLVSNQPSWPVLSPWWQLDSQTTSKVSSLPILDS